MPKRSGLMAEAGRVVEDALRSLPGRVREVAAEIPVILFEDMPGHLVEEGWEPDLLGLFDGGDLSEAEEAGQARILLFLGNIHDFAEGDLDVFREEVRITFLHELGHLLALDEDDLGARGLA